jgi:tyrosine-protein kinase Etk/Wzc
MNDSSNDSDSGKVASQEASDYALDGARNVDLLEYALVVAKHKRAILTFVASVAIVTAAISLFVPNKYTATAVIMPPRQDQSSPAAFLGELIGRGSGGGAGIATALGLQNPNDLYASVLKSRTVADRLIDKFKLHDLYEQDTLVETREELAEHTNIVAGKDGLIAVSFEDKDPKRAAAIANAYIDELEALTADLAISDASRRRKHFEQQVHEARGSLAKADQALKVVQEQTGLIKPSEQAQAIFAAIGAVRAQVAAKEVELSAMQTFATPHNPEVVLAQDQLKSLKVQLARLESNSQLVPGNVQVPTSKVPEYGLLYLEKFRDVRYYEALYELLAKQLELARIEEGKNSTIIQLVDKAVEPDKKSKPKRTLIVLISAFAALVVGILYAFVRDNYGQISRDPSRAHLLRQLITALGSRKAQADRQG